MTAAILRAGIEPEIVHTERPGHAYDLARAAIDNRRTTLIAVGGDGTVFEVANAILDAKADVPGDQWVEVFYEDFLRDPVATFRQVFEGCGLGFDARLQAHCGDVLDIPYNAFSEIRLDKWKDGRNRDRIEHVLPQVVNVAARMGY